MEQHLNPLCRYLGRINRVAIGYLAYERSHDQYSQEVILEFAHTLAQFRGKFTRSSYVMEQYMVIGIQVLIS